MNQAPTANAGTGRTVLAGAAVQLEGSGTDPEGAALTYAWTVSSKPNASNLSASSLTGATTSKPSFVPDAAGAYVLTLVVSDGKLNSAGSTVTVNAQATDGLNIAVDPAGPAAGTVKLSLSASTLNAPVSWYVDLNPLSGGESANWNTTGLTNGDHLVLARVQLADTNYLELRRTVTVANPTIKVSVSTSGLYSGDVNVDVNPQSPDGIASVSAVFDGTPFGTLTAPNSGASYRFAVDRIKAGSGTHAMLLTVVDGKGGVLQKTATVLIDNAPAVTLTEPLDGAFVNGRLQITGSYATDKPGVTVNIVAKVGSVTVFSTTAQNFSGSYDLTGLAPGGYPLSIEATDSTGHVGGTGGIVVVTSTSALTYKPFTTLDKRARLIAADGDRLLYRGDDLSLRLRDTVAGTEVLLQNSINIVYDRNWQISEGRVYVNGKGDDCAQNFVCVYQWDVDGQRKNLSTANPWAGTTYQEVQLAKAGHVLWCNCKGSLTVGSFTIYRVADGAYFQVKPAAEMTMVGNDRFDMAVLDGVLNVFYWGTTGGSGTSTKYDVYRWSAATQVSTRLSTAGQSSLYVATDGVRAAWLQAPVGNIDTGILVTAPLAGGATTVVSTAGVRVREHFLRDGVLAWREFGPGSNNSLKAATASAISTLSTEFYATVYGVGDGIVVFGEGQNEKLYSWNAQQGKRTLRVEFEPNYVAVSGRKLYFLMGQSGLLYKLELD